MISIRVAENGLLLPVRALPGARRNDMRGEQGGALKISVTQAAEKGKANAAIRDYLAQVLQLRRSQVELASGATSNRKQFLIRDIQAAELESRLLRILKDTL